MRKTISLITKILCVVCAFLGVVLTCVHAVRDGYSHWSKMLLYFTSQSNIWLGVTLLIIVLFRNKFSNKTLCVFYWLKLIFTVSITLTSMVFCCVLAPFADYSYHVWAFSSLLVHVFAPAFAIADFFIDEIDILYSVKYAFVSLIPPLCYFVFAVILGACGVDFGRGDTFPYFFLNFNSNAGLFGFYAGPPAEFGSIYWIIFLFFFIYGISVAYIKIKNKLVNRYARKNFISVFLAKIPFGKADGEICLQRKEEIERCSDAKIREQKYSAWQLLEYAIEKEFGVNAKNVDFKKVGEKWTCSVCDFSISHSKNLIAVAVGDNAVGVDVELIDKERIEKIKGKFCSEEELEIVKTLKHGATEVWCVKESVFKRDDLSGAHVKSVAFECGYACKRVVWDKEKYLVCAIGGENPFVRFNKVKSK